MNTERDLSKYPKQVSTMFAWPRSEKEWSSYRLRDEQVAFFKQNGYLTNVKLFEIMDPDYTNATPDNLDSTG